MRQNAVRRIMVAGTDVPTMIFGDEIRVEVPASDDNAALALQRFEIIQGVAVHNQQIGLVLRQPPATWRQ